MSSELPTGTRPASIGSPSIGSPSVVSLSVGSLGTRLRAGREALGLGAAEAAAKLRISVSLVEAIERDDFARLGAAVYARGYLTSYARLVGMPTVVVVNAIPNAVVPAPQLQSATHVSHGRFLIERYSRRAASIVLTASIVVPVIWLATEQRLPVQPVTLRSLDSLPIGSQNVQPPPMIAIDGEFVGPPVELAGMPARAEFAAVEHSDLPVVASFAPFMAARNAVSILPAAKVEMAADSAGWLLRFRGDSWVEVTDHDGKRLEFGVVRAGSEKRYPSGRVAKVALGNASVVEVIREGQALPLAPFQRANVARFAVSSGGELKPTGG